MSQRSPLRPCLGNLTTPMAKAVSCCWSSGCCFRKVHWKRVFVNTFSLKWAGLGRSNAKCWQRRVFSALFANSTLTSTAAYSFSHGWAQTWASLRHVAITLSFRRASLSKLRLTIFELKLASLYTTNEVQKPKCLNEAPSELTLAAAVKRRPAVMQPTLQTRVCRFQEEKQPYVSTVCVAAMQTRLYRMPKGFFAKSLLPRMNELRHAVEE